MSDQPTKTWLVLDMSYLAYRALYSLGDLTYEGAKTGVTYGILRDIVFLQHQFRTSRTVFCFDHGPSKRLGLLPTYKVKRHSMAQEKSEEELAAVAEMRNQLRMLKHGGLERIGFRNVLFQYGYEADDLIAQTVSRFTIGDDQAVIVGADKDFYQLLRPEVSIWSPVKKEELTCQWFEEKYRIHPRSWVTVKAMAGCDSDNVDGIDGIGEVNAVKHMRGLVKSGSAVEAKIIAGADITRKNIPLVMLPFEGVKRVILCPDRVTREKWVAFADSIGAAGLRTRTPYGGRS